MPGFDGMGPRREGPMTGGGKGFCKTALRSFGYGFRRMFSPREPPNRLDENRDDAPVFGAGKGGLPWGGGRGRVFGGGRGSRRRFS
jgi:hypothetical protein